MMETFDNTLQLIARHLIRTVEPLQLAFADLSTFENLLFRLGWDVESIPDSYQELALAVEEATER